MGKRPAEVESFVGNMGSIQREDTGFYAKRRTASHGNGTRTNSSEGSVRANPPIHVLGASHHEGASVGESVSDSNQLGHWCGWADGGGGEGELWGLD
jgi:hypothetical protein